jgi:hypothetical protein
MEVRTSIYDIWDGDIILEGAKTFLSKEIQWFEDCEYSHALRCFWERGKLYAYEAKGRGPTATPFEVHIEDYINKKKVAVVLRPWNPYTQTERDIMFNFVNPLCGDARYGYWNLIVLQGIRLGWKKIFGKSLWLGGRRRQQDNRFYICGELVARQEFMIRGNIDWVEAAPVDLYNLRGYSKLVLQFENK